MAKPSPRALSVIDKQTLSPNLLRIALGGDALEDFPADAAGGYVKLVLPEDKTPADSTITAKMIDLIAQKKVRMRSYTVRAFDANTLRLTLDIVSHGDKGPASTWANHCVIGDRIIVNGPGAVKLVDNTADWFFIAGDMTALPAISVNLEQLPSDAKGYAVIEIIDEADKQTINAPDGIQIIWVVNPTPDKPNTLLADAVKIRPWLEGKPSVWVASEFETMRNLRRFFRKERNIEKNDIYISSYWKMGDTDEGNKAAKKSDPEAE